MKKFLSILIIAAMLFSAIPASAAVTIELNELEHDEYMYEETVLVSGYSNTYVILSLYYPESYGGTAKFMMTYSPDELSEGIEIALGAQSRLWPEGVWTITVQSGEVSESLEFTLSEYVDRTETPEDPDDDGATPPGTDDDTPVTTKPSNNGTTVTSIILDKTKLSLTEGETETVSITTSGSSLTVEVDDSSVISASISGKTLTVSALKRGTSQLWVKSGNNYASITVEVSAAPITEKPTEPETEPATEPVTEPAENTNPFTDIENHWAKDSILALYEKGIVNGMDSDTFAPDDNVTRAQFVTMLCKAFDLKSDSSVSPFADVDTDDWFYSYVMAAYSNDIAKGGYDNKFNPNSLVTRQDMAVFAHRGAVASGKIMTISSITTFADHTSIKDYAIEAVYSMKSAGIINGMTETTFEPLGNATRAQAAHIIYKLLEL